MYLAFLLLVTGLTISAVAIYYSVIGLAAIFAAATIPIYIMGGTLEVAKLVAASWLKANWNRAPRFIKYYMGTAVLILMTITSMGIFGFLSKAHLDQSVPTGDVAAQVALIDEKIKTQRDNIEAARNALSQMDAQVNQRLSGTNADQSAERSVQIRRQQAKERSALQNDISKAQSEIAKLNEQRAPIASQLRKVEAEVGPIKYIAQFIYGQSADQNLLEKAVTWVIILIVVVFDPLAVAMLLAAQMTFAWVREDKNKDEEHPPYYVADVGEKPTEEELQSEVKEEPKEEVVQFDSKKYSYLEGKTSFWKKPQGWQSVGPMVFKPEERTEIDDKPIETVDNKIELPVDSEELQSTQDGNREQVETVVEPTTAMEAVGEQLESEVVEDPSKKKTIHDQEEREADNQEQITYVQNAEQSEGSIWKKIRTDISNNFKPKDFLYVEFSFDQFQGLQFDIDQEPELDKFIKDIQTGQRHFSDYSQEQLRTFATKIYEFRKNQSNNTPGQPV